MLLRILFATCCLVFAGCSSVHLARDVDLMPQPIEQRGPEYPVELKFKGVTGDVVVDFVVNAKGRVSSVRIVRAVHPALAESAANAVWAWRFSPAIKGGVPVAVSVRTTLNFDLIDGRN